MSIAADVRLGDRYHLVERIAVGGMGEVWRARDELLGRDVAVKVLKEEYAADPSFLSRFRAEARHTAALSHPGIANVYDYGEIGSTAYLVMEYVAGEPLSAVLDREGPLPPQQTLDILGQVGLALQAAHDAGVVHRDIKPGNLLLRPDGVVKVTDFGIARAVDAAPVTQTGLLVGTASYLSPEQASGLPVTPASDIYSLGVVGYECLAGSRPFTGDAAMTVALAHVRDTPPPLPAAVPPIVSGFVMQALDKDPARRQRSAADFGRTALALAAQLAQPDPDTAPGAAPPTGTSLTRTRPLTAPIPVAAAPATAAPRVTDDADRRRVRNIFIAVGCTVVVLGFLLLRACGGTATTTVPRVTGLPVSAAQTALSRHGLDARRRTVPDPALAGTVLGQDPKPGVRLDRGGIVLLTVSGGPAAVTPVTPSAPPSTAKPPKHDKPKHDKGHGQGGEHGD